MSTVIQSAGSSTAHVALLLYGSRGDIQPGVCLALELLHRGHRVSVVVPPNLVGFAKSVGITEVFEIGHDTDSQWSSDTAMDAQRSSNPLTRARFALATVRAGIAAFDAGMRALFITDGAPLAGVDLVVAAPLCQARALAVTERLAIGLVVLRYAPMSHNGSFGPETGLLDAKPQSVVHRAWRAYDQLVWSVTGKSENRFRRSIGMNAATTPFPERLNVLQIPQIQAFDPGIAPEVVQEWAGEPLAVKPVVGFFDLPGDTRRSLAEATSDDADLAAWLSGGTPPIFVGFGSMPVGDPDAVMAVIRSAARTHGVRVVFSLGAPRGIDASDPDVFHVGAVDHSWLLPRCVAAVHHGGAGTTAATLRAGIPSVIYAFTAEQPFWARRIATIGLGAGRRFRELSEDHATADLAIALGEPARQAAAEFALQMIDPRRSVGAAASIVESAVPQRGSVLTR